MSQLHTIAERVFPAASVPEVDTLVAAYQPRALQPGQMVVRIAPSPTGFMHIGTVYMGLINYLLARQSGGKFILRIEDTDQKREVEGTAQRIIAALEKFGIHFDEGPQLDGSTKGAYGPYTQSARKNLYQAHAKQLLRDGKAYLCFCTPEELEKTRELQMARKQRTGYYGAYAHHRNLSAEEVLTNLDQGKPFVVRMKSLGRHETQEDVTDLVMGTRRLPQNDIDIPIIKANDGLPTYHFAHVIDDHYMQTTHVIRADEWYSSLPLHLELFKIMGWTPPHYAHLAPIQVMDGPSRRKLSKRKDPESNIEYFYQKGYPVAAMTEYLLNLANSDFEDWRTKNPTLSALDFKLDLQKTSPSGALFDSHKLDSISRRIISEYTQDEVYDQLLAWAQGHDQAFHARLLAETDYMKRIFNIERTGARKRKDICHWSMVQADIAYFFDDTFTPPVMSALPWPAATVRAVLHSYLEVLNPADTHDQWWDKVRAAGEALGFTADMKAYKQNKDAFQGSIADFMKIVRLALTGRENSPDVLEITHVLGWDKAKARLQSAIQSCC